MKSICSMLTSGDVVELDLGVPEGGEAGFRHPAVVVTAQRILDAQPNVIQVVPPTSTVRGFAAEVTIQPDTGNGLRSEPAAQCQHIRAVSTRRVDTVIGTSAARWSASSGTRSGSSSTSLPSYETEHRVSRHTAEGGRLRSWWGSPPTESVAEQCRRRSTSFSLRWLTDHGATDAGSVRRDLRPASAPADGRERC